jgi:aminoglycoside/choline kinase family phosphotransferase
MDINRPLEIAAFLDENHWGEASPQPFDGDFSPRRYARLTQANGKTAILMDAEPDQRTPQFVAVAKILLKAGLKVPEIYAAAPGRGLVLMQDLGLRNVGALLDAGENAKDYLLRAAEVLAQLHSNFTNVDAAGADLIAYNDDLFTAQAQPFLDFYIPFAKQRTATDEERRDFHLVWQAVLRSINELPQSLTLRDFMPDNLMDLPDGDLGVLDFQDAGIGPTAYDLASLCEEVRRDGNFTLLPEVIAHYRAHLQNPPPEGSLKRACTILSAQRHTRLLGNLVRLADNAGRRDKLVYLPRILNHLKQVLREPYLLPIREWMERGEFLQ